MDSKISPLRRTPLIRRCLSVTLSLSLSFSPMLTAVAPYSATAEESDFSKAFRIADRITQLLDRAAYPDIPRTGKSGMPTAAELADVHVGLITLRNSLHEGYLESVLRATNDSAESNLLQQIEKYFEAVARYEGLKIMLEQPGDPESWEKMYTLKFPVKDLAQAHFLELVSTFSQNAVLLPVEGYDKEGLLKVIARGATFYSHLEPDDTTGSLKLVFRVNPTFAESADRFALLARPSLKSALKFAGLFAITRLYDSLILTRMLLRKGPADIPEPPAGAGTRFTSMRLKGEQARRDLKTFLYKTRKPALYKLLMDSVEAAGKQSRGWAINDEFSEAYGNLTGEPLKSAPGYLHRTELENFGRALASLINLTDPETINDPARFLISEAKRLALRSLFLANEQAASFNLPAEKRSKLEELIDKHANSATEEILNFGGLSEEVRKLAAADSRNELDRFRQELQIKLQKAAVAMRDFEKSEVNIAYLAGAQSGLIEPLKESKVLAAVVESVASQPTYEAGYLKYKEALTAYLGAFRLPKDIKTPLTIDNLNQAFSQIEWNADALKGKMPEKYLNAMNPRPKKGWLSSLVDLAPKSVRTLVDSPEGRRKDLDGLLQLGRILKFDVYESLDGKRPTLQNLKFDNNLAGSMLKTERKAYLEEMKKDLMNASPLLGGLVPSGNPVKDTFSQRMVWEYLVADNISPQEKFQLTERQLQRVEEQIHQNGAALEKEFAKLDAVQENDTGSLGQDMLVIATRASQITVGLQSFASFQSFYDEMRRELLLPGFWRNEWQQFTSWTSSATNYMILFLLAQMFSSTWAPLGKAVDVAGKMLAPIFGTGFSRLNILITGMLGISISDQVYRGWISEPANLASLRRYFECGADAPCVALYSDVKMQTDIMMGPRTEAIATVVFMAAIVGGFRAVRAIASRISGPPGASLTEIKRDMATLGLREGTPLDPNTLEGAVRSAIARANANPDPLAAEVGRIYARQAYFRLESRLYRDAVAWVDFNRRFQPELRRLGLEFENWKDPKVLMRALQKVEGQYTGGEITYSTYQEFKSTLMNISVKLQPVWKEMENPFLMRYYERLWQSSGGTAQKVSLNAQSSGYLKHMNPDFLKEIERYIGPRSPEVDSLLEQIAAEVKKSPGITRRKLEEMKGLLVTREAGR